MEKLRALVAQLKALLLSVKENWKEPAEGRYVPYKELAAYSAGGAGVYFIVCVVERIVLNAGSMLVGASIGLKAIDLQTLNVFATLILLLFAPIRAMAFDNTKGGMGKFRPYLLAMGPPTALISILFVCLPYERMAYDQKLISVFVVYTVLQFFFPFYSAAFQGLIQVMSANSGERAWVIELSSIVSSLAPSIVNPVMPLIGPLDSLKTYRIAFPVFCVAGLVVSTLAVFGTKEKVIVPKRYIQKMGLFEGIKKVSRNKYFWIVNLSGWLSFLTFGYGYLFQWVFYYGMQNAKLFALMIIIKGGAWGPGMLLGAPLTNKLGKKRICLFSMTGQLICLAAMLLCYRNYTLFFVLMFLKDAFASVSIVYLPSMKADMMDYQQYRTGDRLEGFIDQIGGMIGGALGLATGYVIPFILKLRGLTDNYEDLYEASFREPIVRSMLVCAIVSFVLSIIPFLFYDLNEERRAGMIQALKIRAMFDDYLHSGVTDEKLLEGVGIICEAREKIREYDCAGQKPKDYATYKTAVDEFEKYRSQYAAAWEEMRVRCEILTANG